MKHTGNFVITRQSESGAALVTVVLISLLLVTASAAMLTAVGASSKNNTDTLSEAKAYYAAESGLQAAIHFLRNQDYSYSDVSGSTLSSVDFTGGLIYTCDYPDGSTTVAIGPDGCAPGVGTAYKVSVQNPDPTDAIVFSTYASFAATNGSTITNDGRKVCIPSCPAENPPASRTEVEIVNVSNENHDFTDNPTLATFTVNRIGTNPPLLPSEKINFRIDIALSYPRSATRTIRGWIKPGANGGPVVIEFASQVATLVGSTIELCSTSTSPYPGDTADGKCPTVSFTFPNVTESKVLYADMSPVEPYRLVVSSVGYGPNGAQKHLQGILQKNFFNDLPATSAVSLIGPQPVFQPGPGSPSYCGHDQGYEPGEEIPNQPTCVPNPNVPSAPSVGVSDPTGLGGLGSVGQAGTMEPPADVITDGPEWQQTPAALDAFLAQLRLSAQNSGTYLPTSQNGNSLSNIGNFSTGTGLTFCEGNCNAGAISGGGILVVTGKFIYGGNFNFRGLIIVTGTEGMHRNGTGSGVILGNVVIAPYDPLNLAAGFSTPSFTTSGGGTSDIIFSGISASFDGTGAISNFMLGIAEK